MIDFAFLRLDCGQFLCGKGPFESLERATDAEVVFYHNDFLLSDGRPWKKPAEWFLTSDPRELLVNNGATPFPAVEWEGLTDQAFRRIYDDVQSRISCHELEKSVPVLTERGRVRSGDPAALLRAVGNLPAPFWAYGYRFGESGAVGATPERLFSLQDGVLRTMALAGTASKHEQGEFVSNAKEIREHEFVADYLAGRLGELGEVERGERQVLDLGSIVHFMTRLQVVLTEQAPPLSEIIALLHPTPALGAYPRGEGALRQLMEYRDALEAPKHFGAPFGAKFAQGFESVVSIRNLSWRGSDVYLPSGCGLIRGSRFENEWRELSLKRNSVKALLGL
ncbi:MAG: chorismate-binding protein [Verrucomicrobiales bacterium]|nr:chorismate-binding protein [Verrucomicrobiales bacterium]